LVFPKCRIVFSTSWLTKYRKAVMFRVTLDCQSLLQMMNVATFLVVTHWSFGLLSTYRIKELIENGEKWSLILNHSRFLPKYTAAAIIVDVPYLMRLLELLLQFFITSYRLPVFRIRLWLGNENTTDRRTYNVTLKRIRDLFLLWKSNKYYIFVCVCVCARARARVCEYARGRGLVHVCARM
jgi:hypothetical protein